MATRNATRAGASASVSPAPPRRSLAIAQSASTASPQLLELRRQWKWAAVSQFFYTFAHLIALDDVSLVDVEEDLVNSTMVVIPRLMQRLLVTLSQDRKITVDNWQTALRRQYLKRDAAANPIGIEPVTSRHSRAATVETDVKSEERDSALPEDAPTTGAAECGAPTHEAKAQDIGENNAIRKSADVEPNDTKAEGTLHTLHSDVNTAKKEESEAAQNSQTSMKDWSNLEMLEKLESIHTIIEWHFQSPLRLRSIMRSDDEDATWRIEPIGYDAKRNTYWLIGPDRLWIQRSPPKPPKKSTKRKAGSHADTRKTKVARVERSACDKNTKRKESSKKAETSKRDSTKNARAHQRTRRGSRQPTTPSDTLSSSPGGSGRARAAKTQANVKLDLQAKQLAAAKAEMEALNRKSSTRNSPTKPSSRRTLGIRISRRLRGGGDDDEDSEWQPIPEEWLPQDEKNESKPTNSAANGTSARASTRDKRTRREPPPRVVSYSSPAKPHIPGLESDDESDLTELSDSEVSTHQEDVKAMDTPSDLNCVAQEHENTEVLERSSAETQQIPGFIEWETICVSLQEWEEISHRFEKATHYLEKALHKVLVQEVVPFVTESLRELERERMKENALMNRKRSSRLAVREMEKEAARLEAARRAEEDEKMARLRRLEARAKREEEERLQRELARDQRRKEREGRELARSQRLERNSVEAEGDVLSQPQPNGTGDTLNNSSRADTSRASRHRSGKKVNEHSGESENWELDCEICGSRGINRDDGVPLMSCGRCNKWQHINCHDSIDRKAGRPLRNWDTVDFFCKRCKVLQNGKSRPFHGVPSVRVSQPVIGCEHRAVGQHPQQYTSSGLTNGYGGRPVTANVSAPYQRPSSTSFAGFTHYQPQQHGFSPHPSVPYDQHHLQSRTSTDPSNLSQSPIAYGNPGPWDARAQSGPSTGRSFDLTTPSQPSQTIQLGPANVPSSYHHQPYGVGLDGSHTHGSTQAVQYPHTYFSPSQQRMYNNPASYHPQP